MRPAQYSVIRYIADAGRNEARNVGILAWTDEEYRLRVDEAVAARVVREHPWLQRDALRYLGPHLCDQLDAALERAGWRRGSRPGAAGAEGVSHPAARAAPYDHPGRQAGDDGCMMG